MEGGDVWVALGVGGGIGGVGDGDCELKSAYGEQESGEREKAYRGHGEAWDGWCQDVFPRRDVWEEERPVSADKCVGLAKVEGDAAARGEAGGVWRVSVWDVVEGFGEEMGRVG